MILRVCPRCASTDLRIQLSKSWYCHDCELGKMIINGGSSDDHYSGPFPKINEEDLKAFKEHVKNIKK